MKEDKNTEVTFESGNVELTRYLVDASLCGVMRTKPWSQYGRMRDENVLEYLTQLCCEERKDG